MRTLFALIKLAVMVAWLFSLVRCDTHLKEKYEHPRYHLRQT